MTIQDLARAVPKCGTCRFCEEGRCHRMPPASVKHPWMSGPTDEWPEVNPGEWCGEYDKLDNQEER